MHVGAYPPSGRHLRAPDRRQLLRSDSLESLGYFFNRSHMFKGLLSSAKEATNASLAALSIGHQAHAQKRIEAIEALWATIREMRRESSSTIMLFEMCKYPTAKEQVQKGKLSTEISEALTFDAISKRFGSTVIDLEPHRVFLGEALWSRFNLYAGLQLDFAAAANTFVHKGGDLDVWRKEIKQRDLPSYFNSSPAALAVLKDSKSLPKDILRLVVEDLMFAVSMVVSGRDASLVALDVAEEANDRLARVATEFTE